MDSRKIELDSFFKSYALRVNEALQGISPDIEKTTRSFASCFVEASPVGIICGQNDKKFKKTIPEGYERYRKIGITSMTIVSKSISLLNDFHAMVTVNWKSSFTKKDNTSGSILFDVIYMLQTINNEYKIFAYITGDEEKALKEQGLV